MINNINGLDSSKKMRVSESFTPIKPQSFTGKKSVDKQHEKDIYLKAKESPKEKNDFWEKALIATGILGGAVALYCKKDSIKKFLKMGGTKTAEEETAAKLAQEANLKSIETLVAENKKVISAKKAIKTAEANFERVNKAEKITEEKLNKIKQELTVVDEKIPSLQKESEEAKKVWQKDRDALLDAERALKKANLRKKVTSEQDIFKAAAKQLETSRTKYFFALRELDLAQSKSFKLSLDSYKIVHETTESARLAELAINKAKLNLYETMTQVRREAETHLYNLK